MIDNAPRNGPFYHGTRAALGIGEMLLPGRQSNYDAGMASSWIYFSATLEAATWGAELATGDGRERIYVVEPTGEYFDDPNLTDKKFPGNPTRSYRSQQPLRIVGERAEWQAHSPEQVEAMKAAVSRLLQNGAKIID